MIVDVLLSSALIVSGLLILHVYAGFAAFMTWLATRTPHPRRPLPWMGSTEDLPFVTVLIGVRNEAANIEQRIANLLDTEYPAHRLEVFVVADGCTDDTTKIVHEIAATDDRIILHEFVPGKGPHAGQNLVAECGRGEVVITTDAETRFNRLTIPILAVQFTDPEVGVAGGRLTFVTSRSRLGGSYSTYRSMEYRLRDAESKLGVLVKTDGACTAYRRRVWSEIEIFEDVDHVICAFARTHGLRAVYADDARSWDRGNETIGQDIRQRARMTRKTMLSMANRWPLLRSTGDRKFRWVLLSHRVFRVLSPVWLGVALLSATTLLVRHAGFEGLGLAVAAAALTSCLLCSSERPRRAIVSFAVAQYGFGLGLVSLIRGDRSGGYRPIHHS